MEEMERETQRIRREMGLEPALPTNRNNKFTPAMFINKFKKQPPASTPAMKL